MRDVVDPDPPLFVDAVEIPIYLDADRDIPYAERLHRDRTIGASLTTRDPVRRVRAWRAHVSRDASSITQSLGQRLERGRRVIGFLMLILGAIAGIGVASAVLHYDGTWPVNVLTVLAVLVLLQLALVVLALILMLPRVPGIRVLQDLMGGLNPSALIAAIYKRIAHLDQRQADLLAWPAARGPAVAGGGRWAKIGGGPQGAVAGNKAARAAGARRVGG